MQIQQFSNFVTEALRIHGTGFTLNGSPISADDMASPTGLLPLIVIELNNTIEDLKGSRASHANFIRKADPSSHLLGCEVHALPPMPAAMMRPFAVNAIKRLSREPLLALQMPIDASLDNTLAVSELSGHIVKYPDLLQISTYAYTPPDLQQSP